MGEAMRCYGCGAEAERGPAARAAGWCVVVYPDGREGIFACCRVCRYVAGEVGADMARELAALTGAGANG